MGPVTTTANFRVSSWGRVSLCSPGWTGIHYVKQAGLVLMEIHQRLPHSASQGLELKTCAPRPRFLKAFPQDVLFFSIHLQVGVFIFLWDWSLLVYWFGGINVCLETEFISFSRCLFVSVFEFSVYRIIPSVDRNNFPFFFSSLDISYSCLLPNWSD